MLWAWLASCAWVSRAEYDRYLDPDGDGSPLGEDCAPDDPLAYPGAPDRRGDGCDTDCGAERDRDGDDWPDVQDCRPADPHGYPCSPWEEDGDGVDQDCDGEDAARTDSCATVDPNWPVDAAVATCAPEELPSVPTDTGVPPPDPTVNGVWTGACVSSDVSAEGTMDLVDQAGVVSGSFQVDAETPYGPLSGLLALSGYRQGVLVTLYFDELVDLGFPEARLELLLAGDQLTGAVVPTDPPVPCTFLR